MPRQTPEEFVEWMVMRAGDNQQAMAKLIAARDAEIAEEARRPRTGRCPDCGASYAARLDPSPGRVEFDARDVGFTLDQEPTPDPSRSFPKNAVD